MRFAERVLEPYGPPPKKNTIVIPVIAPIKKQNRSTKPRAPSVEKENYKPRRKYTKEERDRGVNLLRKGFTTRQVATALDVSTQVVRYWKDGDINSQAAMQDIFKRNRRDKPYYKCEPIVLEPTPEGTRLGVSEPTTKRTCTSKSYTKS
jgi:hypothetical protein